MAKLTSILQERFLKKEKPKITALAERTTEGNLTVFSGIFAVKELDAKEKEELQSILYRYAEKEETIAEDLQSLIHLTSEVKAIHNQAIILLG